MRNVNIFKIKYIIALFRWYFKVSKYIKQISVYLDAWAPYELGNPLPSCSLCLLLFSRRAYCEKFLVFRCQQGEVARHVAAWLLLSPMQRRKVRIHYARLSIFVVIGRFAHGVKFFGCW